MSNKRKSKLKINDYRKHINTKICKICHSIVPSENTISHLEQKHNFEIPVNKVELNNLYKNM